MTLAELKARVEQLLSNPGDSEGAHMEEDAIHQAVLAAIASGKCTDPQAFANEALRTLKGKWSRWYA